MLFDFVLERHLIPVEVEGDHGIAWECQLIWSNGSDEFFLTYIGSLNSGTRRREKTVQSTWEFVVSEVQFPVGLSFSVGIQKHV